jgi:uncharacterized ion transporter superfamily protein YfcC
MIEFFSEFLDQTSNFLANRKGLLPLLGIGLVIFNLILVTLFPDWFFSRINLFLHLGIIIALIGQLLAWAL